MYFRASRQSLAHHRNLDKYRKEIPSGILEARSVEPASEAVPDEMTALISSKGAYETTEFGHSIGASGISELDREFGTEFGHDIGASGMPELDEIPQTCATAGDESDEEEVKSECFPPLPLHSVPLTPFGCSPLASMPVLNSYLGSWDWDSPSEPVQPR